jgi:hypothetical protein
MEAAMRRARFLLLVSVMALVSGCYAARIETGLTPSNKKIVNMWASCWIYGLVPPTTIKASTECTNGVAIVETQHSFLNQVVGILTWGIYTPIQIVVTCAEKSTAAVPESGADFTVAADASLSQVQDVFTRAAEQAVRTGRPVYVDTGH